ncbi:hypothetical protein GCM10010298_70290 [Streptomyces microflavus]|nr:hypothetical protein GCM10010298_70290 [Streptomyces microflavus]
MAAGWFGLIGATVGASGALMGGWLQQRYQAKPAKDQRRNERRLAAGQVALDMLVRLRRPASRRLR